MERIRLAILATALTAFPVGQAAGQGGEEERTRATSASAEETYQDVQKTLGSVPTFIKAFPKSAVAGAWAQMKSLQMGSGTAIEPRVKELIGLGVAAQIPCRYCTYFHEAAAKTNGATDEQVREAVAKAALAAHWGTYLREPVIDLSAFRREVDRMFRTMERRTARAPLGETGMREAPKAGSMGQGAATERADTGSTAMGMAQTSDVLAGRVAREDVHRDVERTFGFVPAFLRDYPEAGLAGAWAELRALDVDPSTALTAKEKALVGVAVASRMGSEPSGYFNMKAARMHGATDLEIREAVAMAALTQHWSAVLNGLRLDERQFQREVDQVLERTQRERGRPGK